MRIISVINTKSSHLKIRNELILSSSQERSSGLGPGGRSCLAVWDSLQDHPASLSLSFPICQTPNPPGGPSPGHGACALLCETEGNERACPQGHRNNTFPASLPHSSGPVPSLPAFAHSAASWEPGASEAKRQGETVEKKKKVGVTQSCPTP